LTFVSADLNVILKRKDFILSLFFILMKNEVVARLRTFGSEEVSLLNNYEN